MSKTATNLVVLVLMAAIVAANVSGWVLYGMHQHPWWAMPVRWTAFSVLAIFAIAGAVKLAADWRKPSP
ncbi:MAG: hypothetical protein WAN50_03710 [Minisyncoccia bacterium]